MSVFKVLCIESLVFENFFLLQGHVGYTTSGTPTGRNVASHLSFRRGAFLIRHSLVCIAFNLVCKSLILQSLESRF